MNPLRLPENTQISSVQFLTGDARRLVDFYHGILGFPTIELKDGTALLSASGNQPTQIFIEENKKALPRPRRSTGLFHVALLMPSRRELARVYRRLYQQQYPFQGFADHGVSEAFYLADPDGNGIELYADRPREQWPYRNGELEMVTGQLDLADLVSEISSDSAEWTGIDPRTRIGHIHLMVSDLLKAEQFYHSAMGFDITQRSFPGALFVSAGGYHHHIGLNIWASRGAPASPPETIGLKRFGIRVGSADTLAQICQRLQNGISTGTGFIDSDKTHQSIITHDFDGIEILVS